MRRAIMLRLRRREVSAYVMPTAPVGLRRMRELRNCHFSGNFVTETALPIGAVETNQMQSVCEHWVSLKITTFSFISLKEKV